MRYTLLLIIALTLLPVSMWAVHSANANYRLGTTATDTWPTAYGQYGLVDAVKIADVDGDSSNELVTAGTLYNGSSWGELRFYHMSSGSLVLEGSQLWSRPGSWSSVFSAVEAGDVDGDGLTETVVVGNTQGPGGYASHIGILRWTGSSIVKERVYNFTGPAFVIETRGVALWTKTGVYHIVTIGYYDNGVGGGYSQLGIWSWDNSIFTKKALYNWTTTGSSGAGAQGFGVATGDVDQDGTPDIVTVGVSSDGTSASAQLRVWNWDGSSLNPKQTREWSTVGQYSIGKSVYIRDLNGDNTPEIIVAGEVNDSPFTKAELTVWSDSTGSLTLLSETSWLTSPLSYEDHAMVSAADVDGDGAQEIVTAGYTSMPPGGNYGTITAWSWEGSSTTMEKSYHSSTADTRYQALAIGDLDGDGRQEITVAGQKTGRSILEIHNVAFVYGTMGLSVNPSPALAGQSVTVSGALTNQTDGVRISSAQVQIEYSRDGGAYQLIATILTDSQGRFGSSFTPSSPGSYAIRTTWDGDEEHMGTTAHTELSVSKASSVITLSSSTLTAKPGDMITVSGNVYPATSATITVSYTGPAGASVTHAVTSDATGAFSDQQTVSSAGEWKVSASWAGSTNTAGTSSNTIRVQTQPEPIGVALSPYGLGIALVALGLAAFGLMRKNRGQRAQPSLETVAVQPTPVKTGVTEQKPPSSQPTPPVTGQSLTSTTAPAEPDRPTEPKK